MKTNQSINCETALEQFKSFTRNIAGQLAAWARKKPAQRTAFLFICDKDAEQWQCFEIEYKTGKKDRYRLLSSLFCALLRNDELYNKAANLMQCVTRQRRRDAKKAAKEG